MDLETLVKVFLEEYASAPLYGGYSRTLRKKTEGKSQVKSAFIENIKMLATVSGDSETSKKVKVILKAFEQEG